MEVQPRAEGMTEQGAGGIPVLGYTEASLSHADLLSSAEQQLIKRIGGIQ